MRIVRATSEVLVCPSNGTSNVYPVSPSGYVIDIGVVSHGVSANTWVSQFVPAEDSTATAFIAFNNNSDRPVRWQAVLIAATEYTDDPLDGSGDVALLTQEGEPILLRQLGDDELITDAPSPGPGPGAPAG